MYNKEPEEGTVFTHFSSVQFSSVAQSCLTLCDPINCSTPGLPVHHQLPEFTQTYVHQVGDAIQPSHPLSSPSPPAPNPSQHQGLFQWVKSSHEVAKVLEFQLRISPSNEHSRCQKVKTVSVCFPVTNGLEKFHHHCSLNVLLHHYTLKCIRRITWGLIKYSRSPCPQVPHLCSINLRWKIFKKQKFQKVPKSKTFKICTGDYLHSIYIALGV